MRVLIVDDETPARAKLCRLLARVPDIKALAEASDGIEALARIADFRPDAIFLDIEMPELSGLELAASLPEPVPLLVFVTVRARRDDLRERRRPDWDTEWCTNVTAFAETSAAPIADY
jgi:two-component system LytT family response regulator